MFFLILPSYTIYPFLYIYKMKITIPLACLRNDVLERADCGNDFSDTL